MKKIFYFVVGLVVVLMLPVLSVVSSKSEALPSSYNYFAPKFNSHADSIQFVWRSTTDSLLNFSKQYLGLPYRRGGKGPNGFDCSGFVSYVFKNFGYTVGSSSADIANKWKKIQFTEALPGDIIYFKGANSKSKRVGHSGIILHNENGIVTFIHSSTSIGISITTTNEAYYKKRVLGAVRVLEINEAMSSLK